MVKGVSRRVIVVKSPDPKLFEQAIFIVKEEAIAGGGVTAEKVLLEARRVANRYVKKNSSLGKSLAKLPPAAWAAAGALLATVLWALGSYLGI